MKSYHFAVPLLCLLSTLNQAAAEDPMELLKSRDLQVRRAAIDAIQTLEDPRIPGACLPLLRDEGLSIRRQAARAIGSRSTEIPASEVAMYLIALREYEKSAVEGGELVARRAIGLLTRDFSSPAFSSSPDGKWVLYEQWRLPMLADTRLENRQLLGIQIPGDEMEVAPRVNHVEGGEVIEDWHGPPEPLLKLEVTNEPLADLFRPVWQPDSLGVTLQPRIQHRFFSPTVLWRASDGAYRVFTVKSFAALYGKHFPHWSTCLDFEKWDGRKALFWIHDVDDIDEMYDPVGIHVSVDLGTWEMGNHFLTPSKRDKLIRPPK